jgi:hypothetical protein
MTQFRAVDFPSSSNDPATLAYDPSRISFGILNPNLREQRFIMKILSPKVHGILDYAVVAAFALAPTVLGLSGLPAFISYALAVVHLLLTLVTAFPLGVVKIVPLQLHGKIEFIVSIALVALPWILGFAQVRTARDFYAGAGLLIFVVWLVTDYRITSKAP